MGSEKHFQVLQEKSKFPGLISDTEPVVCKIRVFRRNTYRVSEVNDQKNSITQLKISILSNLVRGSESRGKWAEPRHAERF